MLLVTGGGGFVMSNVVKQWLEASAKHRCIVLDLNVVFDDALRAFLGNFMDAGTLEYVNGSVTDPASWQALESRPITHMIHGAAITPTPEEEQANPSRVASVNIMGSILALDFAVKKSLQRTIYVSRCVLASRKSTFIDSLNGSDGVFNDPGLVRSARAQDGEGPWPQKLYPITKFTMEKVGCEYCFLAFWPTNMIDVT
jgi:nucleoside-diphosphate-sugar epimerase